MTVSESCLAVRADCVAYVDLMSTPATWSAVAFSVPHVVCPVTESCPGIDTRPAGDIVKRAVEDPAREEIANRLDMSQASPSTLVERSLL